MDKATLRQQLLAQRSAIEASAFQSMNIALVAHLQRFVAERGAAQVFSFVAHKGEPDLAALRAPVLGLPVVSTRRGEMAFYRWHPGDTLLRNRYGIAEPHPSGERLTADSSTVILVPSVALDRSGGRLGYGGGYYDRFFAGGTAGALVVGVAFAAFVVDDLPCEPHDLRVAFIATETGLAAASCGPQDSNR